MRVAPNNQLPFKYIIEVWRGHKDTFYFEFPASYYSFPPSDQTIAVFKIRKNKLPTKHKFNAQTQPHPHLHHGRDEIDQKETSLTGENETPRPPSEENGEVQPNLIWKHSTL